MTKSEWSGVRASFRHSGLVIYWSFWFRISGLFLFLFIGHFPAEQQRSDADHGGAFGDGGFEIVAHAHAQVPQAGAADLVPLHFLEDLARAGEHAAGLVGRASE